MVAWLFLKQGHTTVSWDLQGTATKARPPGFLGWMGGTRASWLVGKARMSELRTAAWFLHRTLLGVLSRQPCAVTSRVEVVKTSHGTLSHGPGSSKWLCNSSRRALGRWLLQQSLECSCLWHINWLSSETTGVVSYNFRWHHMKYMLRYTQVAQIEFFGGTKVYTEMVIIFRCWLALSVILQNQAINAKLCAASAKKAVSLGHVLAGFRL